MFGGIVMVIECTLHLKNQNITPGSYYDGRTVMNETIFTYLMMFITAVLFFSFMWRVVKYLLIVFGIIEYHDKETN